MKLMTPRPRSPLLKPARIVGLFTARGAAGFNKGGVVILPLPLAKRYFTGQGNITTIDLVLEDGVNEGTIAERIRAVLPQGLNVHSSATRTQLAKETLASLDQGLLLATVLAVALGICIILNTFLMNVSERRAATGDPPRRGHYAADKSFACCFWRDSCWAFSGRSSDACSASAAAVCS